MLKRLDNIGIAVSDARRAGKFYVEKLGFEGEPTEDGGFSVTLGDLALYLFESQDPLGFTGRTTDYLNNPVGIDHLAFEVDDIEAASAELESKGIVFDQPIVGDPGFRYRGFRDPDGTMLYILDKSV